MENKINLDNFTAEVQQRSRELSLTNRVRWNHLLEESSAYRLVHEANKDGLCKPFAREIIEKMYLAVFGGENGK